jgi:hypothetical protein
MSRDHRPPPHIQSPLVPRNVLRDLVASHLQSLIDAEHDLPQHHATVANPTHQFERHLTILVATLETYTLCKRIRFTSCATSSPRPPHTWFTPLARCPGVHSTPYPAPHLRCPGLISIPYPAHLSAQPLPPDVLLSTLSAAVAPLVSSRLGPSAEFKCLVSLTANTKASTLRKKPSFISSYDDPLI